MNASESKRLQDANYALCLRLAQCFADATRNTSHNREVAQANVVQAVFEGEHTEAIEEFVNNVPDGANRALLRSALSLLEGAEERRLNDTSRNASAKVGTLLRLAKTLLHNFPVR